MSNRPEDSSSEASLVKQALAALRGLQSQLDAERQLRKEPIAILGMGCRYPCAASPADLWQMLLRGEDGISDVPGDRWKTDSLYDLDGARRGMLPSRRGGFLHGLDRVDAAFFGIAPREAPHVDPRQRLMLEIAWEALEDAGIPPDTLAGSQAGVFLATLTNDYDHLLFDDLRRAEIYSGAGTANSVVANRISYFLNLRGPSLALDTACSGALVAVHLACESLRRGESSLALAGGVSVNLMAKSNVFFARSGALSPAGLCRTFDAAADGIVRSDGAGILVLKKLSEALKDGDPVLAVIRGSAVNHDGRSNGIMAPNGEAQRAVLAEAYRNAGISASSVQYVELHGTGTPLGDPIEAQAILEVLGEGRAPGQECLVGSLKSNIGHSEAAAGVGGIIKTVLAMRHRQLPPTAHFQRLNPMIPFAGTSFRVAQQVEDWPNASRTLLAGVSGFGFGGTNAHVVIEEAPRPTVEQTSLEEQPAYLLPISVASPQALTERIEKTAAFLESSEDATVTICATAANRRTHLASRIAVVGATKQELISALRSAAITEQRIRGRLAFIFSGQGSHWAGMGRQLDASEPAFRATIDRCEELLQAECGWSLRGALAGDDLGGNDTAAVQPAIFALQVALGALWRSWGIVPDFVCGHSLGEAAAAHFAGVLCLEDALRVVVARSRLMRRVAGLGKTAVLGMTLEEAEAAIRDWAPQLGVAGSNSPASTVIAGTPQAVEGFLREQEKCGIFAREVAGVDIAFHSPQMDPLRAELVEMLADIKPAVGSLPLISTVTGKRLAGESFDASYWGRNLREPFLFTPAIEELLQQGCDTFVEVSPHAVLSSSLLQTARVRGTAVTALSSLRKGRQDELRSLYETLAVLYRQGRGIDWRAVYPQRAPLAALPPYPWQRQRYWFDQLDAPLTTDSQEENGEDRFEDSHPLLGARVDAAFAASAIGSVTFWQNRLSAQTPRYMADHLVRGQVMMPGAAWIEMTRAAGEQLFSRVVTVEDISFEAPLLLGSEAREVQTVLTRQGERAEVQIFSRAGQALWERHVTASITVAPDAPSERPSSNDFPPEAMRVRCPEMVSAESHYEAMRDQGLEYGPAFRLLTGLARGNSEAVGNLRMPEKLSCQGYGIHPVLLDAALQLAALAQGPSQDESAPGYLPVAVKGFTLWRAASAPLACHVLLRGTPGDTQLQADLNLTDPDGRMVARLQGLVLQRLAPHGTAALGLEEMLIQETWIDQHRAPQPLPELRTWLLFAGAEELAETVAFRLAEKGQTAKVVYPGQEFRAINESSLEVCVMQPEQLARLFREETYSGVALLPGAEERFLSRDEARGLAGCGLSLAVTQTMIALGLRTRLALVSRGGQALGEGPIDPWQASLAGFALTAALEHPEWRPVLIDLAPEGDSGEADELSMELLCGEETRIALRGGQRFASRIQRLVLPAKARSLLMPDATYLITGGLGALGLKTADRMIRDGARSLVLTGRRVQESPAVEALRALGARVTLAACDLAQADQVASLFEATLAALPPLRGVIHAAGVIEDALLPRQTAEGFRRVLSAKVAGAWNLHRHTRLLPLDFFVLYSSAASLLGSAGQANYAAGNSFLDALAHHRRRLGLPAISIDWGAWSGPGMAARPEVVQRLKAQGIAAIDAEDGLELLSRVISGVDLPAQIGVFPAQWKRFAAQQPMHLRSRLSTLLPEEEAVAHAEQILDQVLSAVPAERFKALCGYLQRVFKRVLGYSSDIELGIQRSFFEMGMDSLTAVEFRNRIQEDLRLALPVTLVFDAPDIATLAHSLETMLATDNEASSSAGLQHTEADDRAALDGLSDNELAQLLMAEIEEGESHGR